MGKAGSAVSVSLSADPELEPAVYACPPVLCLLGREAGAVDVILFCFKCDCPSWAGLGVRQP